MLDEFKTVRQEIASYEERSAFRRGNSKKTQAAKVRVLETVYPGVKISIGQAVYTVNDPIKYAEFIYQDGEVRLTSLS